MKKRLSGLNAIKEDEGKLTPDEVEKVVQAFQAFDKDNNGYIDEYELKCVLESILKINLVMGQDPSDEDVLQMIIEVVPEGENKICKCSMHGSP